MNKTTPMQLARDLLNDFYNGNREHVRIIINSLSPRQAAAVAFYMCHYVRDDNVGSLGRLLEHDVYEFEDPIR